MLVKLGLTALISPGKFNVRKPYKKIWLLAGLSYVSRCN